MTATALRPAPWRVTQNRDETPLCQDRRTKTESAPHAPVRPRRSAFPSAGGVGGGGDQIGAGTGVAPFRAFLEERSALGCRGSNWLFFGQSHEATGFYYRDDWFDFLRRGVLTQLDTAFSHDQPERIYVPDRMIERAPTLWRWLRDGAYVYLCGDARALAPAVDAALERIAAQCGRLSPQEAAVFIHTLHREKTLSPGRLLRRALR